MDIMMTTIYCIQNWKNEEDERHTLVTRLIHILFNDRLTPLIKLKRSMIEKEIQYKNTTHSILSLVMDDKAERATGTSPHSELDFSETGNRFFVTLKEREREREREKERERIKVLLLFFDILKSLVDY
jgi:hypothetical protein